MLLGRKLSWQFERRRQQSDDDDDSRIQKCYWEGNYFGNYKEGNKKVRMMMIQEYRNVIRK